MTAEQLSRLRRIVEAEIRDIHTALEQWRACNGLDENGRERVEDTAERALRQDWKHATDRRMMELLRLLGRMEEEDFGVCQECGEDIPLRRLEMVPTTTLCARCMERQEQGLAVA
ncbi:transcriptional regulator, TraR/DksA family [Humidesulfovibrio mexicanus]|uniref:Transcriptional regulator, TraR/DksA family n=1 Tax=Humidesulfovibrio mexicanus TaxID=147047 RepID=A0A238Z1B3_9BACT|nr:TraR/DksA C4-type zinc finger protein [Humidesulfovibrio mexicanus]SNR76649.1 transcriptional regulator, TraR/DksA family [Humidesulfovibrio mexicanus]